MKQLVPICLIAVFLFTGCRSQMASRVLMEPPACLPELESRVPWTGETFDVPPPVMIPDDFWNSPAYRRWTQLKDIETFRIPLHDGRLLVAEGGPFGVWDRPEVPLILSMKVYRADGTLEMEEMTMIPRSFPGAWTLYAKDGKTKTLTVDNHTSFSPDDRPFIKRITFYKDGQPDHQYVIDSAGWVVFDWELTGEGNQGKLLHPVGNERRESTTQPGRQL